MIWYQLFIPNGVQYDLGSDNGLRHYFIDSTAVTTTYLCHLYDHGSIPVNPTTGMRSTTLSDTLRIDPSECVKFVAVHASGEIERGRNVVVVRPEAKTGGYVDPKLAEAGVQLNLKC
jgi:hypothetical protein